MTDSNIVCTNLPESSLAAPAKVSAIDNFPDLIRSLDQACATVSVKDCQDAFGAVMERTNLPNTEWGPYALSDENKLYTRNLVHLNDNYALIILYWNPEKESPIHDHPCEGCWLKVIQGSVQETIYSKNDQTDIISEVSSRRFEQGSLAFMNDSIGLHKIANTSVDSPAISLHLYSPPYQACKIWPRTLTASQFLTPVVCYFSIKGVRVQDGLMSTVSAPVTHDLTSPSWGEEEEKSYNDEEKDNDAKCV